MERVREQDKGKRHKAIMHIINGRLPYDLVFTL